tara:strand:- start:4858 stop:5043 length:186 start_codon:yes stop_codon:yes gene_type:complete
MKNRREARSGVTSTEKRTIYATGETWLQVKLAAKDAGVSVSAWMSMAISAALSTDLENRED